MRDLERMLGKKTMEAEILKEVLDLARPKKRTSACCRGAILRTIPNERHCPHSGCRQVQPNRATRLSKPRGPYRSADDLVLLAELCLIIDQRPTYGYRRVTALLNRQRRKEGQPTINTKRVLRILQQNGLTLQKHTALRPGRTHDGVVVALRSTIRWCSDHLEIHARNGEVVRIVFAMNACDREIIAWSAVANAGISGEMVCDLMIAAVERRFQTLSLGSCRATGSHLQA